MPDLIDYAADNPEFARVIELARLRDLESFAFDIAPKPEEAAAIARLMAAQGLRKLRFAGTLDRLASGGWQLEGKLGATVIQTCVVSLDPVTTRIDQEVARRYLPQRAVAGREVILSPDDEDEIEPLGDRIDLGLVAIETLALALPPYPRKPGAALGDVTAAPSDGVKPFAALAALRDKLDGGS